MTSLRPLRGRIVIKPDRPTHVGSIILPDMVGDWIKQEQKSLGIKAQSSHTGTVLLVGPPALTRKGAEIKPDFRPGDRVQFVWTHNEGAWTFDVEGVEVCWVPQANVIAVHERNKE
jgi:co-chaperonin GroES (HSP10)